jgi:hypothetical protein
MRRTSLGYPVNGPVLPQPSGRGSRSTRRGTKDLSARCSTTLIMALPAAAKPQIQARPVVEDDPHGEVRIDDGGHTCPGRGTGVGWDDTWGGLARIGRGSCRARA